jgi:hypothetical protein
VLELGHLSISLLQLLQLNRLSALQHLSYSGFCQQRSSSLSVQLAAPPLKQVGGAYCQWMSTDVDQPAPYVKTSSPINSLHTAALARFRLGVHHLEVSKGRWNNVQRENRLCLRCDGQHVEDEKHVMFECCWYMGLRERFKRLYKGTGGPTHPPCMQRLMNFPNQECSGAVFSLD